MTALPIGRPVRATFTTHTRLLRDAGVESFTDSRGDTWTWDAFKVRYVRTPAGAKRYGVPIGSPIPVGRRVKPKTSRSRGRTGQPATPATPSTPAPSPAPTRRGTGKVKLDNPAQRDIAERHFGRSTDGVDGTDRGAVINDQGDLDIVDHDKAIDTLDRNMDDPDVDAQRRGEYEALRDRIAADKPETSIPDEEPRTEGIARPDPEPVTEVIPRPAPEPKTAPVRRVTRPPDPEPTPEPAADPALDTTPRGYRAAQRSIPEDWANDPTLAGDIRRGMERFDGQNADGRLAEVWKRQGFNAKPEVLSPEEFAKLGRDHRRIYRGITADEPRQAAEWADQFRHGDDPYPGAGLYGNGTYVSTDKDTAHLYATAQRTSDNGVVLEMALRPDAKVWDMANPQHQAEMSQWLRRMESSNSRSAGALGYDQGVVVSAMGYDAIRVPKGSETYYVVLNRSAVIINGENVNAQPG